ncbi:MbeB family mobilization protein, partial [Klebsiella pneumoniae]
MSFRPQPEPTPFSEHEKSVRAELSESEKRISAAILDHDRKLSS